MAHVAQVAEVGTVAKVSKIEYCPSCKSENWIKDPAGKLVVVKVMLSVEPANTEVLAMGDVMVAPGQKMS